jgi:long-chain acyl-CoA synthetase
MSWLTLREVLFDNPLIDPARTSVIAGGRRLRFADLRQGASAVAEALRRDGISRGDRVALLLKNCPEFLELFFGITAAGAVAVPLNTRLHPKEHARLLQDCEPRLLVASASFQASIDAIVANVPSLARAVLLEPGGGTYADYASWRGAGSGAAPAFGPAPGDDAAILYTSGTTSSPKGVVLSHHNYVSDLEHVGTEIQPTHDSVNLQLSPMYHAAFVHSLVHLAYGACTALNESFDVGATLERIESEAVTYFFAVPTMLYQILDHPRLREYDLGSLRLISYGAAAITGTRLREAIAAFGNDKLLHAYGLTESTSHSSVLHPAEHLTVPGSIGRGLHGVKLKLIRDDGSEVAAGEVGEITVKGDNVMKGYWRRPEETARTIVGGWLRTGDLGKRDAHGYVYVVDRKKDMVISGGVNIFPRESEEVLSAHPSIAEVAVFGVPDPLWGESLVAAVVLRGGCSATPESLLEFARAHLAGFKLPKDIRIVDALPKTASGKVQKTELRRNAAALRIEGGARQSRDGEMSK